MKERIPTFNQANTLKWLAAGDRLIVGEWPDCAWSTVFKGERIYWERRIPEMRTFFNPEGIDRLDCGNPKLTRYHLSHMERYGWLVRTDAEWVITEEGRRIIVCYDEYMLKVQQKIDGS